MGARGSCSRSPGETTDPHLKRKHLGRGRGCGWGAGGPRLCWLPGQTQTRQHGLPGPGKPRAPTSAGMPLLRPRHSSGTVIPSGGRETLKMTALCPAGGGGAGGRGKDLSFVSFPPVFLLFREHKPYSSFLSFLEGWMRQGADKHTFPLEIQPKF